jgi:hypothetical protein
MIAKRVVPKGFEKSKMSAGFKKEARKLFNVALTGPHSFTNRTKPRHGIPLNSPEHIYR